MAKSKKEIYPEAFYTGEMSRSDLALRPVSREKVHNLAADYLPNIQSWDAIVPTAECLHCHGSGHANGDPSDPNPCGFCD